jgi:hypothetical protein
MQLPPSALHPVGTSNTDTWTLNIHDQPALDAWLRTWA